MSARASWWSITINNPTDDDRNALKSENWPTWVKRYDGQEEVGKDGTLHIQGALNTAQIRFAAVKGWLKRAHIEAARDKSALLKYVAKSDTAVEGTYKSESKEYLTMDKALKKLATYYVGSTFEEWENNGCDWTKCATKEYWAAVNKLLEDDQTLVQLYTNPQMLRAWVHTKNVWIKYKNGESSSGSAQRNEEGTHSEEPNPESQANLGCTGEGGS